MKKMERNENNLYYRSSMFMFLDPKRLDPDWNEIIN